MDIHKEIDTRGLNCPLPILKAKKSLNEMESGQLLKVVSTDLRSFSAFLTDRLMQVPGVARMRSMICLEEIKPASPLPLPPALS